jgi:hypothetical protein
MAWISSTISRWRILLSPSVDVFIALRKLIIGNQSKLRAKHRLPSCEHWDQCGVSQYQITREPCGTFGVAMTKHTRPAFWLRGIFREFAASKFTFIHADYMVLLIRFCFNVVDFILWKLNRFFQLFEFVWVEIASLFVLSLSMNSLYNAFNFTSCITPCRGQERII